MIYLIEFSDWNKEPPSIEGAYKEYTTRRDWRTMGSLEHARSRHWFNSWYDKGINHREENGMIVCEIREPVSKWFVKIDSLEQLADIIDKLGCIKIRSSNEYMGNFPIIDLFD